MLWMIGEDVCGVNTVTRLLLVQRAYHRRASPSINQLSALGPRQTRPFESALPYTIAISLMRTREGGKDQILRRKNQLEQRRRVAQWGTELEKGARTLSSEEGHPLL